MKKKLNWKNTPYGGQAVLDGVMIKSPDFISISIRNENDKIVNETYKFNNFMTKHKFWNIFFFRGIASMVEMVASGLTSLTKSVNMHVELEEEELSPFHLIFTILISLGMALVLFKLLPFSAASLAKSLFGIKSGFLFNLIDAVVKILILFIYLLIISMLSDIKTLFQYHGAEHKAVHTWDKYHDMRRLTLKNAKKFKTLHPRCGTSFLLFVVFVSLLVYLLIPISSSFWTNYLFRILLLPIIVGLSYEFLKLTSKHQDSFIMKLLMQPGLLMQKISTSEPSNSQLEVALYSLKSAIRAQKKFEKE